MQTEISPWRRVICKYNKMKLTSELPMAVCHHRFPCRPALCPKTVVTDLVPHQLTFQELPTPSAASICFACSRRLFLLAILWIQQPVWPDAGDARSFVVIQKASSAP